MADNNQIKELLPPVDTYPRYHEDNEHQIIAREVYKQQVVKQLESLDSLDASSMSLGATGELPVVIKINGEVQECLLPIKTIPGHVLLKLGAPYQACAATIPRSWNPSAGEWDESSGRYSGGWDQDPSHPRFTEVAMKLGVLTRDLNIDKVLHGIDIPLKNRQGEIVWSNKEDGPRDRDQAIKVLEQLGIRDTDIEKIATAIDDLSLKVEMDDEEEFLKKSLQP